MTAKSEEEALMVIDFRISLAKRRDAEIEKPKGELREARALADRVAADFGNYRERVRKLAIEVDSRIQQGAQTGGHLAYVQSQLDRIMRNLP